MHVIEFICGHGPGRSPCELEFPIFILARSYVLLFDTTAVIWHGLQDVDSMEQVRVGLAEPTKVLLESNRLLPLLTQLKVLSRKQSNRKAVGESCIASLLRHLNSVSCTPRIKAEGANVVLNICYEKENVDTVLRCGAAATLVKHCHFFTTCSLSNIQWLQVGSAACGNAFMTVLLMQVGCLGSLDEELQANAAGALQSICFQPEGRRMVRELGAIPPLVDLLSSPSLNVSYKLWSIHLS